MKPSPLVQHSIWREVDFPQERSPWGLGAHPAGTRRGSAAGGPGTIEWRGGVGSCKQGDDGKSVYVWLDSQTSFLYRACSASCSSLCPDPRSMEVYLPEELNDCASGCRMLSRVEDSKLRRSRDVVHTKQWDPQSFSLSYLQTVGPHIHLLPCSTTHPFPHSPLPLSSLGSRCKDSPPNKLG